MVNMITTQHDKPLKGDKNKIPHSDVDWLIGLYYNIKFSMEVLLFF